MGGTPARDLDEFSFNLDGGEGNDVLTPDVTTRTDSRTSEKSVMRGVLHGADGLDEMTFISRTVAGGVALEGTETSVGGTSTIDPSCILWIQSPRCNVRPIGARCRFRP